MSQGLVAGMSETIATSFGSRRRFLMNQVRAFSLLSLGRAELVGRGADLADAVEPCSRRPHGDGAPPRVDRQSGREDVLLPRARRAAHAVDALREPLYVAEPFPPRERVPLDAEHLRLHRCEEPLWEEAMSLVARMTSIYSMLALWKIMQQCKQYAQNTRRYSAAFGVTETAETDFRISLFPFVDLGECN